jgi:N-hydroxyarylamine O-acetyltransferase
VAGAIDLDAYFARIGFGGEARPTLGTLAELHALHPAAIAFENLSPFIGEEVALDAESLQRKLVAGGRGGWCFEQNLLFAHVLRAIGFRLTTLAARVRWNAPPGEQRPRSHMLLQVHLPEGDRIADVGFGGLVLTAPLELGTDREQQTPNETFRLHEPTPGAFLLEAHVAGEWLALYAFDLHEQLVPDYEVSNWYLANHPRSPFVTGVVAARSLPGVRHALRSGRYAIHRRGEESETHEMRSVDDYRRALEGPLGIRLPDSPELDRRLARLLAQPSGNASHGSR